MTSSSHGKSKRTTRYIPLTADARGDHGKAKNISRSQYVFVRVGRRVHIDLWYTAPTFAPHAVTPVHPEAPRHGTATGCGAPFDTPHGTNRPWRFRGGRIYNTSNRGTRISNHVTRLSPAACPLADSQLSVFGCSRGSGRQVLDLIMDVAGTALPSLASPSSAALKGTELGIPQTVRAFTPNCRFRSDWNEIWAVRRGQRRRGSRHRRGVRGLHLRPGKGAVTGLMLRFTKCQFCTPWVYKIGDL